MARKKTARGAAKLRMVLGGLQAAALPEAEVPLYYEVWRWEGDESVLPNTWMGVIRSAFGDFVAGWDADRFRAEFVSQPQFDKAGVFFVTSRGRAVGTAMAWTDSAEETALGRLHWLGVDPAHRRKGIARALVLMVLRRLQQRGFEEVYLTTEAFREGAIALYRSLGFRAAAAAAPAAHQAPPGNQREAAARAK